MKQHLLALIALLLCTGHAMAATEETAEDRTPHFFVGLQGGIQKDHMYSFKNWQPTASVAVGYMFNPVLGVRLHANGIWDNGYQRFGSTKRYDYKYITGNADLLVNICNANNRTKLFPVNAYWITGVGLYHGWDNEMAWPTSDMKWAANARVGFAVDVPLCKYVSVNAEVDMNNYIHKTDDHTLTDNVKLTAQLGVAFKFGFRKAKAKAEPAAVVEPAPVPETRVEEKREPVAQRVVEPARKEVPKREINARPTTKEIYFNLAKADVKPTETQKVRELVSWLQEHPNAHVKLTGYADAGTGNAAINQRYSEQRVQSVKQALMDAGIAESRITTEAKGDTVQPFAENDANRVVIAVGSFISESDAADPDMKRPIR